MTVLERLDYAFNVAEEEFEVARLLDPAGICCFSPRRTTNVLVLDF